MISSGTSGAADVPLSFHVRLRDVHVNTGYTYVPLASNGLFCCRKRRGDKKRKHVFLLHCARCLLMVHQQLEDWLNVLDLLRWCLFSCTLSSRVPVCLVWYTEHTLSYTHTDTSLSEKRRRGRSKNEKQVKFFVNLSFAQSHERTYERSV